MSPSRASLALLATSLLAAGTGVATAQAAYAPKLAVTVDPPSPSSASRVTSVITQAPSETANKKVVVSLPAGYGIPPTLQALPVCSPAQESARACPPESRVGSASAVAAVLGLSVPLSGQVFWGGLIPNTRNFKLIVFLDNDQVNQHLSLEGVISIRSSDAGFDTTFDNLPNTTTSKFTLVFDGGDKAIVLTGDTCGPGVFKATFTGQGGESAESSAPVTLSGCRQPAPALSGVKLSRTGVRFTVAPAASVRVLVKDAKDRKVLDRRVDAPAGATTVKFKSKLKKGRYRTSVVATAGDSRATTKKARLTVK